MSPEEALPRAALALTLPGTATLEIGLQGIPAVVAARPSALDAWIAGRRLSGGPYALPNRILGRMVYPELLGPDVGASEIARGLFEASSRSFDGAMEGFRVLLGPEDASDRIVHALFPPEASDRG